MNSKRLFFLKDVIHLITIHLRIIFGKATIKTEPRTERSNSRFHEIQLPAPTEYFKLNDA